MLNPLCWIRSSSPTCRGSHSLFQVRSGFRVSLLYRHCCHRRLRRRIQAFPSKSLRAARSLLGGLGNNLGVQGTPHEMSGSEFLFQQCRTFIQMRTNLKVVDNSGDSVAETAPEMSASCLEPAPEPEQVEQLA
ncbi:unnamed protein product [Camellia sinensis]